MSWLSSRLRAALALVLTVVVCATALAPVSVDAQDARELSIVVTPEGEATRGHNELIAWRVDVTCHAEVGECGNTVIESQLSPGIVVGDIDVASAPGFVVVSQTGDAAVAVEPTLVQLQRGSDLLDGETVSFVVHGRVGPNADEGAVLDHLVLAASNNTSTASAAAAPIIVANTANWTISGFASGEATYGRNETHRVAICGPTEANTAHGDLVLDLALPDGSAIVDSGEGEVTPTGLRWLVPAVTAADLADEHDVDLAAKRAPEYCHEFFPTVRWGAPDFVLGDAIPVTLTLTDSSGVAADSLCVIGCRVDAALSLVASTTVIEATVTGPDVVNAGGLAEWDVAFDASATVEDVQVPLLDVLLPVGLQLERIDLSGLPDGAEAQVYASTDAGDSFGPEPIRTGDTDASMFDRSAFDPAVGASVSINALQIRFTSAAGEPLLRAGGQPNLTLITSPDPVQPPVGSAELCAMATSANAASIEGQSCHVVAVQDAATSFGPVASVITPAAPTTDQVVSTIVQIPMSNGATIIEPIVGALLPVGFEFRGLDAVNAPEWVAAPPRPIIETTPDHDGTGRTLVTFHWTDTDDGRLASHAFAWTPAEMRAAGIYSQLDLELVWRIAAPAGHPSGVDPIDVAATSLISPPVSCPVGATLRDDQLGLGTALVCATETATDTTSGASLIQTNLAAGVELLPFAPIDPTETWCDPTRIDDVEWTSSTCAAPSTPNGRVQFRSEVTNTGNRGLTDVWSYGLLPLRDDVGIDPDTWQTPRGSELAASLTGPLVVSGLPWEPLEADDVVVEYSSAADPCRNELSDALAPWPPTCVDDWTASPPNWADVTAWRVHVPFDRSAFAGATTFEISGEMLVAADADFETIGTAVVAHVGLDSIDAARVRTEPQPISIVVPREDDIIAADPALLPHDLALIAAVNADDSVDLHDGPHGGDGFVVDLDVINQGAPVDSIDVALHADPSVVIDGASGSVLTDGGGSITWSVTPGSPAVLALSGTVARADEVRIPLPVRIADEWASADWSENPLNLIAEIARFDAVGASGVLVDHDSTADLDPTNDVAPATPGDPGDGVRTGDGQPDSGVDADPVADDEDDHDIAGVPLWDLALDVALGDGYDVALDWADPVAAWVITVENKGPRPAFDITVEQTLPAGMSWVDAGAPTADDASITVGDQGQITIDRLDPGAVTSWKATVRATDPAVHDFVFEAAVAGFSDEADLEAKPSALVQDLDGADLEGSSAVWLPWDVAVALNHRATTGLPISTTTAIAFDLVVQNVGRDIDLVVVDVQLGEAGLGALAPDPSMVIVDELGRPIRTTWDLSDPSQPRIQIERSDGAPLSNGARVVVPVDASAVDLSVDPTALEVAAVLSGLDAAPILGSTPDEVVSAVDVNPANDLSELVVPMWDLALSIADDAPILRTVEDRVVADWTITIENQGNRDATDIVVDVDLGDRLVAETTTPVIVPFLAPGEQVDVVVESTFTDGFAGSFAVTAQILSLADANREPQRDVDSRPGELATVDEPFEDDEQRLDRTLPSAIELAVKHRSTTGLPIQPGDSSVTFDVTVRNVGRPLNEVTIVLAAPGLGPVVVDAVDAPFSLRAGELPSSLVLVLPADAPLMPDGIVTLPVTIPIPEDWDGSTPRLVVEADNASAPAVAPMAFWDVALDLELAPEQSENITTSEPVQWALTIANEGNQDAHAVAVAVALPTGMSWVGLEGPGASAVADDASGEVIVSLDRVVAGETATVILSTELDATDRSLFRLVAELVDFDADADPANEPNPMAGDIDSTPRRVAEANLVDGIGQAALSPAEDDQDAADVSLLADVAVGLVLDPATPPRAGDTSSWTISATNQGLDLADATFVLDLDERWIAFDASTLPTVTGGADALAITWDLTNPTAPQARVTGDWPSAATVTIPLELTVSGDASAAGTPLQVGITASTIDDDGFPATPAPVFDDVDGDATNLAQVDLFDLALTVRVDASVALPPEPESTVTFFIDVINQGTVPATSVEVALHPAADQWLPPAEPIVGIVDAANPLAPGATVTTPVTLTLAADANLDLASLVAEISSASGIDFDSTPDRDSTNDAAPVAAGDPTDDATDNRSGDEDDHDLADVQPPTSALGNQIWFDGDHDGLRGEDEQPAAGVLVELLLDANSDGVADDRDLSGAIDNADRLATTTTDADGLFRFDDVAAGTYLIAIPASEFRAGGPLAGWSATIQPEDAPVDGANDGQLRSDGGVTSATITVTGFGPLGEEPNNASDLPDERTDLTIDFGLGQWSLGNQVWYDTTENGLFDAGEEGVGGARLYLFVDANEDGTADDANADGALTAVDAVATTTADAKGRYRFDGLGSGTYIVAVADVTMRGTLGDWAISRFSRSAYSDRDNDSNAAGWSGLHVLSFPVRMGDGDKVNLTVDFGFEVAEVAPIVWPETDLTGFNNPTTFGQTNEPTFFGPSVGEDLTDFESFGDVDLFEDGEDLGESFDFVEAAFFEDGPEGPLAFTGSNSRTLVSWAAMLIVFGAVLVGVSRDPDED